MVLGKQVVHICPIHRTTAFVPFKDRVQKGNDVELDTVSIQNKPIDLRRRAASDAKTIQSIACIARQVEAALPGKE
jgi:hypothetical protein